MMRKKIRRMARGYQGKRKIVFRWDGPYHPMRDFTAYRAWSHWKWSHLSHSTPLADLKHFMTFVRQCGTPI